MLQLAGFKPQAVVDMVDLGWRELGSVRAQVSALDERTSDHAMPGRVVVESHLAEVEKLSHRFRCLFGQRLDLDLADRGGQCHAVLFQGFGRKIGEAKGWSWSRRRGKLGVLRGGRRSGARTASQVKQQDNKKNRSSIHNRERAP